MNTPTDLTMAHVADSQRCLRRTPNGKREVSEKIHPDQGRCCAMVFLRAPVLWSSQAIVGSAVVELTRSQRWSGIDFI